jgi:hypothetical protein
LFSGGLIELTTLSIIGLKVFLPPILNESLKPANISDIAALEKSQNQVSLILSIYGVGGVVGVLMTGPIMAIGPLAHKKFAVFIAGGFHVQVDNL